jgi:hypothetical protein
MFECGGSKPSKNGSTRRTALWSPERLLRVETTHPQQGKLTLAAACVRTAKKHPKTASSTPTAERRLRPISRPRESRFDDRISSRPDSGSPGTLPSAVSQQAPPALPGALTGEAATSCVWSPSGPSHVADSRLAAGAARGTGVSQGDRMDCECICDKYPYRERLFHNLNWCFSCASGAAGGARGRGSGRPAPARPRPFSPRTRTSLSPVRWRTQPLDA